ncbi:MAG: regulatory protein RecX [Proteobacteria bacterium]|nr:regulatory protein RecX [Pseudomonadota bacterium]
MDSASHSDTKGRLRKSHDEQTPTQRALGLLVRREHSRKELARKLTARGVEKGEAHTAIDKLANAGWQDDARFAEVLARSRAEAGYGPLRIRAELATHGLRGEQIAAALAACEMEWSESASALIARRFRSASLKVPKQRRKAIDFLLRRGFASADAFAAVGSGGDASGGDWDGAE